VHLCLLLPNRTIYIILSAYKIYAHRNGLYIYNITIKIVKPSFIFFNVSKHKIIKKIIDTCVYELIPKIKLNIIKYKYVIVQYNDWLIKCK
jgi:hypothetical protein